MDSLVSSNYQELCKRTVVNIELLIFLCHHNIIPESKKQEIESIASYTKQASLLYDQLKSGLDEHIPLLITALKESSNLKAAQILEQANKTVSNDQSNSSGQKTDNMEKVTAHDLGDWISDDTKVIGIGEWQNIGRNIFGMRNSDIVHWEQCLNTHTMKLKHVLGAIIGLWVSQTGRTANVGKFISLLDKNGYKSAADTIRDKNLPEDTKINH